ncbi:MAG: class I SAM-dependent methyltransferase [Candidatus Poribacteria bacterium]
MPEGIWRTSRWLRLYDWDWRRNPFPGVDPQGAADRAKGNPRQFFYHALRVCAAGSHSGGVVEALEYSVGLHQLLSRFLDPAPISPMLDGAPGMGATINGLIERDMLVPEDAEEPVDTGAVAAAAVDLFGAFQVREEFAAALDIVSQHEARSIVEIGTAIGGTLFGWAQVLHPDGVLVSLDMPGGVGGGGYLPVHEPYLRNMCGPQQKLSCILGDSTTPEVIARVRAAVGDGLADTMFIDGDHSYDGARQDFENYRPFVREGGLVLFHDIHPPDAHATQSMGVWRLWGEIKNGYHHTEIVHDPNQSSAGIGILYV